MKLRATITINFVANDYQDAAAHQNKLNQIAKGLSNDYDEVTLDFRERRDFKKKRSS